MKSQRQIIRRHHKESQGSRSFFTPKFPADENRASFHTAGGVTPTVHAHRPPPRKSLEVSATILYTTACL